MAHFNLRLAGLVIAASLLLVAACGGDDDDATPSPSPSPGTPTPGAEIVATPSPTETAPPTAGAATPTVNQAPIDVCAIVPSDDVGQVIGIQVEGSDTSLSPVYSCDYFPASGDQYVTITLRKGPHDDLEETFDANAASFESVDGLGEKAYWNDLTSELSALFGDQVIFVVVHDPDAADEDLLANAEVLMQQVLAGLDDL